MYDEIKKGMHNEMPTESNDSGIFGLETVDFSLDDNDFA